MLARPRDLAPLRDDLSLIMEYLMRINAKLEGIERLIRDEDDQEDGTDS
ncbi:MAG: hypothetical protein IT201_05570 [Thermoleophilia bacterium]|nr:hypothetical protein [Thermoleophilia bacterium]